MVCIKFNKVLYRRIIFKVLKLPHSCITALLDNNCNTISFILIIIIIIIIIIIHLADIVMFIIYIHFSSIEQPQEKH